jgi:H+/Cl- antiporter ClcA
MTTVLFLGGGGAGILAIGCPETSVRNYHSTLREHRTILNDSIQKLAACSNGSHLYITLIRKRSILKKGLRIIQYFLNALLQGCWQLLSPTRKETSYSDRRFWFSYILFIIIIGGILLIFIYITRLASNGIFSPSNKIHLAVGLAKDLSAPLYNICVE